MVPGVLGVLGAGKTHQAASSKENAAQICFLDSRVSKSFPPEETFSFMELFLLSVLGPHRGFAHAKFQW